MTMPDRRGLDWVAEFHVKHGPNFRDRLELYFQELKKRNYQLNLYSRKVDDSALALLLAETGLLFDRIGPGRLVDVGSGNGLLGIPLAICLPERRVVLVESRLKKAAALAEFKSTIDLPNLRVFQGSLDEFMAAEKEKNDWLLARGFPRIGVLAAWVKKNAVKGLTLISAINKIEAALQGLESLEKNVYNIPWRENLVIAEITLVSRETGKSGKKRKIK